MLTYSGVIESGDTMRYLDAVSSVVRFGDWLYDEALNISPPLDVDNRAFYPLGRYELEETLHIYLASFLYRLADILPDVGFVHAVWLFNILVTAVTGWLLFFLALAMGWDARTAAFVVVIFGLCTIAWPYTKSFFRDPLVMPFLVATTIAALRWRQSRYRHWAWALSALFSFWGAIQTKNSAFFALPAVLVMIMPWTQSVFLRRLVWLILGCICLATLLMIYAPAVWDAPFLDAIGVRTDFIPVALHSYLLSVGGSFWGTSPIALLALPAFVLWRGQQKYIVFFVLLLMGYAFGHAFFSGVHWFGGLSWPPRFLVPLAPFIALAGAPFYHRLIFKRSLWAFAVFALITAYSLWIQFNGVALNWSFYTKVLPADSGGLSEWLPGLNSIPYLRWVLLPQYWGRFPFEFAHARAGIGVWVPGYILLALGALAVIAWLGRRPMGRRVLYGVVALPLVFLGFTYFNLRALYAQDVLYWSDKQALHEALDILRQQGRAGDVVILTDPTYQRFIVNYNDLDGIRFIVLPLQPGERPSEKQPPAILTANNEKALALRTVPIIHALASPRERIWLLTNSGPFTPWASRPVERYLTRYYYLIGEHPTPTTDATVRLLEYSTISATDPYAQRGPLSAHTATFGQSIELVGLDLPMGTTYRAGDVLPVSLLWRAVAPVEHDYIVAWFLADAQSGIPLAQGFDSTPSGGFAPTSGWRPGAPVWDNRALVIPQDAPDGSYRLWVVLYRLGEGGEIERLIVDGEQVLEDTILVLPLEIVVRSS